MNTLPVRRDILIVGALFLALAAFLALASTDSTEDHGATSHASSAGGTLALYRWLGELGYGVERLEYRDFALDAGADLLFVLAPAESYAPADVDVVLRWVEAGGTLVVADNRRFGSSTALLRALDVSLAAAPGGVIARAELAQPVASADMITTQTGMVFEVLPADAARIVGAASAPVLVGVQRGAGYIYLSTALRPFTNAGLADAGSAALVLGLLRRAPTGGRLIFDEYHHGFVREPSLGGLLLGSPWGWAVIYAGMVGAAYVVLSGRRFGRPAPLREETARRSSAEYLESMAGLLRRGRKSGYLLAHYRTALKRRLARPYGVSPSLDDDAFVEALASARQIDAAALRGLLARMARPEVGEAEILKIIAEGDKL
ncbi:DUF4350 domain-containing protein [Chloroflexales bacterium ZM16-3]|nr:DUF4350 domain-containing protein [Chloroflexales bacterium ZM16-3]